MNRLLTGQPACAQGPADDGSCSSDLPPGENSSGLPGPQREELPHLLPGESQAGPAAAQVQRGEGSVPLNLPGPLPALLPASCSPSFQHCHPTYSHKPHVTFTPRPGPQLPGQSQAWRCTRLLFPSEGP